LPKDHSKASGAQGFGARRCREVQSILIHPLNPHELHGSNHVFLTYYQGYLRTIVQNNADIG
jgi:hypothetical protein